MEQKEKIEKPEWVEIVESLPEIVRQQVGNTCAGLISSLVQIYLIAPELYYSLRDESYKFILEYTKDSSVKNEDV